MNGASKNKKIQQIESQLFIKHFYKSKSMKKASKTNEFSINLSMRVNGKLCAMYYYFFSL